MEGPPLSQGWDEEEVHEEVEVIDSADEEVGVCDRVARNSGLALKHAQCSSGSAGTLQTLSADVREYAAQLSVPQVAWTNHRMQKAREHVSTSLTQQCAATGVSRGEAAWRALGGAARDAFEVAWCNSGTDWLERQNWLMMVDLLFEQVEPWRWLQSKFPLEFLLLIVIVSLDADARHEEIQELLCFAAEELRGPAEAFENEALRADAWHVASLLRFRATLLALWNGCITKVEQLYDLIDECISASPRSNGTRLGEKPAKRHKPEDAHFESLVQLGEKTLRVLAFEFTKAAFESKPDPALEGVPSQGDVHQMVLVAEESFSASSVRDAVVQLTKYLGEKQVPPPAPRVLEKRVPPPEPRGLEHGSTDQSPMLALVINLERRADRWKGFNDRLAAAKPRRLRVERLSATDGSLHEVPEKDVGREWKTDRNAKFDGREGYRAGVTLQMTPGERGCAMSHIRAWRRVAAEGELNNDDPVLILEDDAVFAHNFEKCMARMFDHLPDDPIPDVLYLGYIQGSTWRRKVAMGIFEAEYLWTTVGYLLWPRGARKLLKALPVDCPVDNFMAWQMASKALRAFAVEPPLIDQEEEWDENSDVRHSDDAAFGV